MATRSKSGSRKNSKKLARPSRPARAKKAKPRTPKPKAAVSRKGTALSAPTRAPKVTPKPLPSTRRRSRPRPIVPEARPVGAARGKLRASNPYDVDLDRNPANFQPLTPVSFLQRAALAYPDVTAI